MEGDPAKFLPRTLEPEVMDTEEEASDYDAMDHAEVNRAFCTDALRAYNETPSRQARPHFDALDLGTGTALIPIELCSQDARVNVLATDLADHMLTRAASNVAAAGLSDRITLARGDVKTGPSPRAFDLVLSNSVVHHIPDPRALLATAQSTVATGGLLLVRDLLRPSTLAELHALVERHAPVDRSAPKRVRDREERQRALFEASLHAALTLDEVRDINQTLGIPAACCSQTSDRHWTLVWNR